MKTKNSQIRTETDPQTRRPFFTERLARVAAAYPWRTILVFVFLLAASAVAMVSLLGGSMTSVARQRGTLPDSTRAQQLIDDRMGASNRASELVMVRNDDLTVDDAAFKQKVAALTGELTSLGPDKVTGVVSFAQAKDPTMVSEDRHAELLIVNLADDFEGASDYVADVHDVVAAGAGAGFTTYQTGETSMQSAAMDLSQSDLKSAEIFGMPAAFVVLILVFGALVAAGVPLVLSVVSIVLSFGLVTLVGQFYTMSVFAANIISMLGLAVGIDYTLFIVSRYREERGRGLPKADAIAAAGATAGRAVFFSGLTVMIAMIGMTVVPMDITISLGLGAILVVFTTLIAALTLLPALLSLLGDRIDALRVPFIGRKLRHGAGTGAQAHARTEDGVWARLAHSIMRHPLPWLGAAAALLLLAASPILDMKTGSLEGGAGFPDRLYAKQGLNELQRDFTIGKVDPVEIVVDGARTDARVVAGLTALQTALAKDERFGPSQVQWNQAGDLAVLRTPLAVDASSDAAQAIVADLRDTIVPAAFGAGDGSVYVGGTPGGVVDYLAFFDRWLPIAIVIVLTLSFVLLLMAFRSVVIAAKAIVLNLLSVGVAYGLMVLVFEKGVGASLLGLAKVPQIEAWVPLVMFAMLFGLSMDYQVFLLSRIKERYDESGDTREAVATGIGRTAGIITGAAAIMVVVFGAMAGGELTQFQQMGFGLAVAILIDATIVRTIVMPAAMELLGDWNWYLPRWLEWLPQHRGRGPRVRRAAGARRSRRSRSGPASPASSRPTSSTPANPQPALDVARERRR